jgi:hypothetical protein
MTSRSPGSVKIIQGDIRVKYYARCKNNLSGPIRTRCNCLCVRSNLIGYNISQKKIPPISGTI